MLVEVVPHNSQWQTAFKLESGQIAKVLADNLIFIHHIGSTAIAHIHAKPIIDILVEVKDINLIAEQTPGMEALGYEAMGEFGLVGRRYFRKENSASVRTHHVHIYKANSPEVKRHLAFRDYMIAHPQDAEQYSLLKQELAAKYPHDIESYMDGKDEFVKTIERKAIQWQNSLRD
ncbi:MAG: GrpB family protein [Cyanobacteria bacterium P01_A01_bin.83]